MKQMELYIHIPFCMRKCRYCDFLSSVEDETTQNLYVRALLAEIAFYGGMYRDRAVTTVYIGGGTPSWLKESAIVSILNEVWRAFTILPDTEVTIECNPGTLTGYKFSVYRKIGINRISIGLQSADDDELMRLGRVHTFAQFLKTYELARQNGFSNINIDLMSGLPGQSLSDYKATLQKVIRLKPEHISAYSLMIEEGTPFYEQYRFDVVRQESGLKPQFLPSEDEVYQMTQLTAQLLAAAGYGQYEISNFALKGYACRHNIGYWRRKNYLGVGLGASSLIDNIRYSNLRDLHEYIEQTKHIRAGLWENERKEADGTVRIEELPAVSIHASAERIGRGAQMEEFMFLGLRMTDGISRTEFEQSFGKPIEAVYQEPLLRLAKEGLLVKHAGRIFLTERGREVSNYAMAQFLLS